MPNERHTRILTPLGILALVAGILLGNLLGVAIFLVGMLLLAFACVAPQQGFLLLGPFPHWELTRAIRRQRLHLWWSLFAGLFGLVIIVGYGFVVFGEPPHKRVVTIASGVWLFMAWNIFLVVISVLLTLMSYAIAEDRDGKRLDFILATDLRSREIVVGKLVGRLTISFGYALPLLPLVILLPILFGINTDLIIYVTAFCVVTLLSMSGVTILSSALAPTKKTGGAMMTLFILPYMLVSFGLNYLKSFAFVWNFPGGPFTLGDVGDFINAGNPLLLAQSLLGGSVTSLASQFHEYAAIHTGVSLTSVTWAARILRSRSATLADKVTATGVDVKAVPPVGERPLLWKERHFIPSAVQSRRKRSVRLVGWLVFAPALLFIAAAYDDLFGYSQEIRDLSRFYVPLLVWIFSVAGSRMGLEAIVRERDKDTLTPLLLTDYTPRQIVTEKFLGLLAIFGRAWLMIAVIAFATVISGGMLWWTAVLAIGLLVVVGTALILLGLQTSASATSLEAASKTFGLKLIPFIVAPPAALMVLIFAPTLSLEEQILVAFSIIALLAVYSVIAYLLWGSALKRFERSVDPATEGEPPPS